MPIDNKSLVRRFFDLFNQGDLDTILRELVSPAITLHDPIFGEQSGPEAMRQLGQIFLTAFPGVQTSVDQVIEENGLVACLHTHTGHHLGDFNGVPPTGRPFTVEGLELFRFENGKVVEFWRHDDDMGLLRQLGLLPDAEQETEQPAAPSATN